MPVIVEWTYTDGSKETDRIPVDIWRTNELAFTKVFIKDKEVSAIQLDPMRETADINEENNTWPGKGKSSRFSRFELTQGAGRNAPARGQSTDGNSMQRNNSQKN